MKLLHQVAIVVLAIGGINWGLIGLFNYNLVHTLFAGNMVVEQLVYILVGFSAVYILATHMMDCKTCMMPKKGGRRH